MHKPIDVIDKATGEVAYTMALDEAAVRFASREGMDAADVERMLNRGLSLSNEFCIYRPQVT